MEGETPQNVHLSRKSLGNEAIETQTILFCRWERTCQSTLDLSCSALHILCFLYGLEATKCRPNVYKRFWGPNLPVICLKCTQDRWVKQCFFDRKVALGYYFVAWVPPAVQTRVRRTAKGFLFLVCDCIAKREPPSNKTWHPEATWIVDSCTWHTTFSINIAFPVCRALVVFNWIACTWMCLTIPRVRGTKKCNLSRLRGISKTLNLAFGAFHQCDLRSLVSCFQIIRVLI